MQTQLAAETAGANPCFFWHVCQRHSAIEKAGRSVCRSCAGRLRGREYPVRAASREALYLTGRNAAEAMDMLEEA